LAVSDVSLNPAPVKRNEGECCDVCGSFGAFVFDGRKICERCYETLGSCCAECDTDDEAGG
jgi:hypothetical protein